MAADHLLQGKVRVSEYPTFFIIRTSVYFGVWSLLAIKLYRIVAEAGQGYHRRSTRSTRMSAGGMMLFALTVTTPAFDWLMSLDPHWYSTIFGVNYLRGRTVDIRVAFLTLLALVLRRKRRS